MSPDLLGRPVADVPIVALDLEMTGLDRTRDRICEVALVRVEGGREVWAWSSLVRPRVPMTTGARAVHGIPDAALALAPRFEEVAPTVVEMLEGAVLVAHHVDFDLAFLEPALARAGLSLPPVPRIDTLALARRLFAFRSNRLSSVCRVLDVPTDPTHRALADARATAGALSRMAALVASAQQGPRTVGDLTARIEAMAPGSDLRKAQRAVLEQAYADRRTVVIDYLSASEDRGYGVTRREVAIWKLHLPRMQGYCHLREAERVFRVDRIQSIRPGARRYDIPSFRARI